MRLKLAVDNGEKHLENMTTDEMAECQQMVAGLSYAEQTALLDKIIAPSVPVLQAEILNPDWFESDFDDPIWHCAFGERKKTIDFNIYLEDGSLLTAPGNAKFLYTIKYWLCALTHPSNNGGGFSKPTTSWRKVLTSLAWIDAILLRADRFQPSKYGFGLLAADDVKALMADPKISSGLYLMHQRVTDYLKVRSAGVADDDVAVMSERYPTLRYVFPERTLDLTDDEIIRARVWLLSQDVYDNPSIENRRGNCNNRIFTEYLNANTLHGKAITLAAYPELRITPLAVGTEYRPVPVIDLEEGVPVKTIRNYLNVIKTLFLVDGDQFAGPQTDLSGLTEKSLRSSVGAKGNGRFRTLPASIVFKSLENAFEFSLTYADDILQAMGDFAVKAVDVSVDDEETQKKTKAMDRLAQQCCSPKLRELGIKRWRILDKDGQSKPDDYFLQLRENTGLYELYCLLMGCIQIIVGTMMARRVGELIDLREDCLYPKKNPRKPENAKEGFFLEFYNRKSGAGEDRENLLRPILLAGAKMLWKLRNFRQKLVAAGLVDEESTLLLNCNPRYCSFDSIASPTYSKNLDTFCDYFEIPVVEITPGELRRYYIRQHQLRRFFAMAFFWGSSVRGDYDGLDTLRYFLGHTDAEHLYHYITENTPGAVLRGVKAEALVYGINADRIEGIEKLRELLKKRFGVKDVDIEALGKVVEGLEPEVEAGALATEPPLEEMRQQLEHDVEILLQEGVIDLEPTFFVEKDAEGKDIQVVNLVLKVKEIEEEETENE